MVALLCLGAPGRAAGENPKPDIDATLGAGFIYQPTYDGSRRYEFEFLPNVDITWRDRVFLSTEDGLGVNAIRWGRFNAGPFLDYQFDEHRRGSPTIDALGEVEGGLRAGLFAEYDASEEGWRVFAKLRRDVGNHRDGLSGELGGEGGARLAQSLGGLLRLTLGWGDREALRPFFGVDATQSSASGLAAYDPNGGLRDLTLEPRVEYEFGAHWSVSGIAGYRRLLSSADRSPIVREVGSPNQYSAGLLLNYHF